MINQILDTPWKFWNEIGCWLTYPLIRWIFAIHGIPWGKGWRFYGVPIVQKHRRSEMRFGSSLQIRSSLRSNPLGPNHATILSTWTEGAKLLVGSHFAMTGGALCAAERITIGNNVTIGANTTVVDTDFHPLNPVLRRSLSAQANTAPVVIEDDVFIGMNCLILKGVTIGQGSVVGAGSVVARDVPPKVIVAGNPAAILRELGRGDITNA